MKVIGYLLMAVPVVGISAVMIKVGGWGAFLFTIGLTIIIVLSVSVGVYGFYLAFN